MYVSIKHVIFTSVALYADTNSSYRICIYIDLISCDILVCAGQ